MTAAYRTAPDQTLTTMPPGIPYIVANEAAERFSFYGMRGILFVYMTSFLVDATGTNATLSPEQAKSVQHLFLASAYFFPLLGAILADSLLGKYRVILWLSVLYCLGHLALATVAGRNGLYLGLALIAIGAGGIKPCVSAHVGDQFGKANQHLITRVFGWFYFSINVGAFVSSLLTPLLLDMFSSPERGLAYLGGWFPDKWVASWTTHFNPSFGAHVAFGVPGVLMAIATLTFWLGRKKYAHIPPAGNEFFDQLFHKDSLEAILKLVPLFFFVMFFWSLYDQTSSAWVEQASKMDRRLFWHEWLPAQIQAINPILVLLFIPLFDLVIYPTVGKFIKVTSLRKIGTGLFLCAAAFAISAFIQMEIDDGFSPNIIWQFMAYVVMTAGEVLVSITCLEFAYTQAPNSLKSLVMSLYLLSVSFGNLLTSLINWLIIMKDNKSRLPGADYYWFFGGMMLLASLAFIPYAMFYKERRFVQDGKLS